MKKNEYLILADCLSKSSDIYAQLLFERRLLEAIVKKLARKLRDEEVEKVTFRTLYDSHCPCFNAFDDKVENSILDILNLDYEDYISYTRKRDIAIGLPF